MSLSDFTTTIVLEQSPEICFDAICNVRAWWAEVLDGNTKDLNDEFTFTHKDIHYSVQKIVETIPNKRIVWLITDARLTFTKDTTEWIGTKVIFEIIANDRQTIIRFTHEGLSPQLECYNGCSNAWSFYINDSLYHLITTGKGKPIAG